MRKLFVWNTRIGPFYIAEKGGRYHPVYDDESEGLGSFASPGKAAEDLAGGHVPRVRGGVDTASLGIPADLSEWEPVA